jgi:hypothetical protein
VPAALLTDGFEPSRKLAVHLQSAPGKGRRRCKVSRNVAALEVARRWTSITPQREIMSRAVNCFRTTPGVDRRSRVSICT